MSQPDRLEEVRRSVFEFMQRLPSYNPPTPIIEVGRMLPYGKVFEMWPQYFVDTRQLLAPHPVQLYDIDPSTHPEICDDIVNIDKHFGPDSLGTVLLLHVLEHVATFWELPAKLFRVLKPGGMLFIQTPWNFRFHGPRPDCWRISDDGYEALFGRLFEFVLLEKVNPTNDYLHPLAINVVLRKPMTPAIS